MAFMALESPSCQVPVGCEAINIQKNQTSAYPVHLLLKYFPCSTLCKWDIKSGKKKTQRDMTKSRQKNSKENKLLFHNRFFYYYSAFLPRKTKSSIYLCKVTLLFCEDIPKTQQCPRIWQKQD